MLTAERIQEYTARGYSPRKLIKSPRNTAKNWQVKTAMAMIDPKDFDKDLMELPARVWHMAEQIHDNEEAEKHIRQAKSGVALKKARDENYRLKAILVGAGVVWFHTIFAAFFYFLGRY